MDRWVAPFPLTPGWRHYYPAPPCLLDAAPINAVIKPALAVGPIPIPTQLQQSGPSPLLQLRHRWNPCHRVDTWSKRINSCTCTCRPPRAIASPANPSIIFFHHQQPQLGSTSACTTVPIALQLCLPEHLPMNLLKGWTVLRSAKGSLTPATTSASTSLRTSLVGQVVGGGLCPATG